MSKALVWLWARCLGLCGVDRGPEGTTLLYVRRLVPGWAAAQTWGDIILLRQEYYPASGCLLAHELVHVRQWRALGWRFPLAYLWDSFLAWLVGAHPYRDNRFEVEARREGGC